MNRCKLAATVIALLLLSACDFGDDPPPQLTVTLTAIHAVKQGSDENVPLDGMPVDGATLTLSP